MSKERMEKIGYAALLIAVPAIAFVPYIPFGNLGLSADDILFLFAALIGAAALIIGSRKNIFGRTRVFYPFIALTAAGIFSCLYNTESFRDFCAMFFKGPFRFFLTILFLFAILHFLNSKKRIKIFLAALALAGAAESIFGIGSFLLSWQGPFNIGIASSRAYSVLDGIISGRVNGTFGSTMDNFTGSNLLASYLVILIPISVSFIILLKEKWKRIGFGIILALQLLCLALTYTRSSIVYLLLAMAAFAWILGKNKKIAVAAFAIFAVFALMVPGLKERFASDAANDRIAIWRSAVLVASDHPLWGTGPGKYLEALSGNIIKYEAFSFDTEALTPHNFFLYSWANIGILGLAAIFWMVFAAFKDLRDKFKTASDYESKILLAGIIASSLGFLMQNFTNNFLFVPSVACYFWAVYAAGVNINSSCHCEE